jgi:undecaprenyl diphosphate synthase
LTLSAFRTPFKTDDKARKPVRAGGDEAELLAQIDFTRLPRHIAIIMDGNGRWAHRRRLPRAAGHSAGVRSVMEIVESCTRLGIPALTLYAFSVENWKRPKSERDVLWRLLREYLRRELPEIHANNVRFQTIGRPEQLPPEVQEDIRGAVETTAGNTGMVLTVALNYGARAELVDAFNSIVDRMQENGAGQLNGWRVSEEDIDRALYTSGLPDPDLLIRTSGELRVSNFLLWQIAYSEIWVTDTLWPDFSRSHLLESIAAYQKRDRRYGGLNANGGNGRGHE